MVIYPITVAVPSYRGSKPALRRKFMDRLRIANALEQRINEQMEGRDSQTFHYRQIADELHLPIKAVRDVPFGVDGGSNGIIRGRKNRWHRDRPRIHAKLMANAAETESAIHIRNAYIIVRG